MDNNKVALISTFFLFSLRLPVLLREAVGGIMAASETLFAVKKLASL